MTFGSLFAGIGGFDLGFERGGLECKWQVEIDDYANKVLAKHWPNVRRHGDVCTFPPEPAADWTVDVICGGFPCQDISYAGSGAGLSGKRSGLYVQYMRIVRSLGPKFVVMENIGALVNRGLDVILGTFADSRHTDTPKRKPIAFCEPSETPCRKRAAEAINARNSRQSVSDRSDSMVARRDDFAHLKSYPWGFAGQWNNEPDLVRVVDGVPCGLDRLRGLGNAVVPQIAEWIGRQLMNQEPKQRG